MCKEEKQQLINEQQSITLDREGKLKTTDYIAAKIAEGKATKTEYRELIDQRQQWRDEINAAQERINELNAIQTEVNESEEM